MTATVLAWERAGEGEPLVLLHGIGTTRDDFAPVRAQLAAEYEVLTVDLPGHGQSPSLRDTQPCPRSPTPSAPIWTCSAVRASTCSATRSAHGSRWSWPGASGPCQWISGGQTPRFLLAVPGSEFRPLFGGGHAPHSDMPEMIVRLVHEATGRRTEH